MKSWIHEISESYVAGHKPVRKDLKENYVHLTEEQRFNLLSENVLTYLDEQLQNAYGIGIKDLNEEQLNELVGALAALGGAATGGIYRAGKAVVDKVKKGAKYIGDKVQGAAKSVIDTAAAGEIARGEKKVEQGQNVLNQTTVGGKLKAGLQRGLGTAAAFNVGFNRASGATAPASASAAGSGAGSGAPASAPAAGSGAPASAPAAGSGAPAPASAPAAETTPKSEKEEGTASGLWSRLANSSQQEKPAAPAEEEKPEESPLISAASHALNTLGAPYQATQATPEVTIAKGVASAAAPAEERKSAPATERKSTPTKARKKSEK